MKTLAGYAAAARADARANDRCGVVQADGLSPVFGAILGKAMGIALTPVPYPKAGEAMRALARREVAAVVTDMTGLRSVPEAGDVRWLAVTGTRRAPEFLNVRTFQELGHHLAPSPWHALFAHPTTPPATVRRMGDAAFKAVVATAPFERLLELGLQPTGYGPERLRGIMRADFARWAALAKGAGIQSRH